VKGMRIHFIRLKDNIIEQASEQLNRRPCRSLTTPCISTPQRAQSETRWTTRSSAFDAEERERKRKSKKKSCEYWELSYCSDFAHNPAEPDLTFQR